MKPLSQPNIASSPYIVPDMSTCTGPSQGNCRIPQSVSRVKSGNFGQGENRIYNVRLQTVKTQMIYMLYFNVLYILKVSIFELFSVA